MLYYQTTACISFLLFIMAGCNTEQPKLSGEEIKDSISLNAYVTIDKSPLDMSYFPVDFPVQKMNGDDNESPLARVIYSRPHKKGREIFGDNPNSLCSYGEPWRLGANEATEITFFKNVSIQGQNVAKGSYVMYCIPYPDRWTIVLNSNLYSWGLYIDSTLDVFKTDVPVTTLQTPLEDFTMMFSNAPYGADLNMMWDNIKVILPIEFSK